MYSRRTIRWVAALTTGVAIVSGSPSRAVGQASPPAKVDTIKKPAVDTSTKRIKIQKTEIQQAGGEVCLPIACVTSEAPRGSITLDMALDRERYARETQFIMDSIRAEERYDRERMRMQREIATIRAQAWRDSVARVEAAERAAQLARARIRARGFYVALAGGGNMAERDIRNGYTGGWNTTIPMGWDASNSPFGFRADLSVDKLHGTLLRDASNATIAASGDVVVWSLNTDVKLRAHAPGTPTRTHVYALAGIGAHRVVNGVYGTSGPNAGKTLDFADAKTNFSWNVGAGMSTAWGPTEVFIESRFVQVKSNLRYHHSGGVGTYTSFVPIVVGLQWF